MPMKISYDPEVDALSITFRETTVTTKHLAEGIAADYDSEGRLAGLEILDAQKRFGGPDTIPPRRARRRRDMNPASTRYELIIYWSKDDDCFVVEVPELPGCMADGRR